MLRCVQDFEHFDASSLFVIDTLLEAVEHARQPLRGLGTRWSRAGLLLGWRRFLFVALLFARFVLRLHGS